MKDHNDEMFYHVSEEGNAEICYCNDGVAVTRIESGNIYPIGAQTSTWYEHPEGIILSIADAKKLGIQSE